MTTLSPNLSSFRPYTTPANDYHATSIIHPGDRPIIPDTPYHQYLPNDKIPLLSPSSSVPLSSFPFVNSAYPHPPNPHLHHFYSSPSHINPTIMSSNNNNNIPILYTGIPPPIPTSQLPTQSSSASQQSPYIQRMQPQQQQQHPSPTNHPTISNYPGVPPSIPTSATGYPSYPPRNSSHGYVPSPISSYPGNPPPPPTQLSAQPNLQQPSSIAAPYNVQRPFDQTPNNFVGGYTGIPPPLPPNTLANPEQTYPFDARIHGYPGSAPAPPMHRPPPQGYATGPSGYSGVAPIPPTAQFGPVYNNYTKPPMNADPSSQGAPMPAFGYTGGRPPPPPQIGNSPFGYSGTPPPPPGSGFPGPHGYTGGGTAFDAPFGTRPGYQGQPPSPPLSAPMDDPSSASPGGLAGLKQKFMQKVGRP